MFNIISWQTFLTITALAVIGYYSITSFLFRKEISAWIKSHFTSKTPVQKAIHNQASPLPVAENIMGAVKEKTASTSVRVSALPAEQIITSGDDELPEPIQEAEVAIADNDGLLIGTVADLLEELKKLIDLISQYETDKSKSELLFNALFIRFPQLQHTSYPLAISFYLCDAAKEQFTYELTPDEVMTWWTLPATPSKNQSLK